MEKEPVVYRDLWKEYEMVIDKTRKPQKLFNKIKWDDIIAHLRLITHDMIEFEQYEQVAQVYRSMGDIFGKIGKQLDQRTYYLKAARMYFKVYKNRREMKFSTYTDLGEHMEEQFLKAVDLSIKMELPKLAGLTLAELGECYHYAKKYQLAHRYYVKSARILQTDFFHELAVLKRIIVNADYYEDMNEPICDLFDLWQPFCRKYPKKETEDVHSSVDFEDENVRILMRAFEIDFVLISLKRFLTQDELGKSILSQYDGNFRANLRTSILTKAEFLKVTDFVKAVKCRNKFQANDVYIKFLLHIIDDVGKLLVKEVINLISEVRHVRPELQTIIEGQGLTSREKMRQMFDYHTMNKREHVPKAEYSDF